MVVDQETFSSKMGVDIFLKAITCAFIYPQTGSVHN